MDDHVCMKSVTNTKVFRLSNICNYGSDSSQQLQFAAVR